MDTAAPALISIVPDSGATNVTPKAVIFRFDEVVSERPSGAPSLQSMFLISPRDGTPNVDWNRNEVAVRPNRGWRRNTVYNITMLPGMTDLRGNVRNTGAHIVFSTGAQIFTGRIAGTVFNWLTGTPAPRAFVEARTVTDTNTVYVAATDSTGAFVFSNLGPGSYRVRGILDENSNRGLDPREAWDTAIVALTDTVRTELYAFPHDSVGARLANVGLRDSVTLELLFDHAVDVNQTFDSSSVNIKRADSVSVPVISVTKPQIAPDTSAIVTVRPSRPTPSNSLLVKIGIPIKARTTLRIRTIGVRGLDGVPFTSDRVVVVEPPPPPPAPPPLPPPPPPPPSAPGRR